jgi:glycerol-3-phosphate dehydrogenase
MHPVDKKDPLYIYGSDAVFIKELCKQDSALSELIHPSLNNINAEVIWAVQKEMAVTVEDVLARRTRMLFLDAKAAMEAVPRVAWLMAKEMGKDKSWEQQQINDFNALAKQYLLS